jgi:hypothetical protein
MQAGGFLFLFFGGADRAAGAAGFYFSKKKYE